jgi:nucleoside phosphorylase/phosphoserine phosphatase
MSSVSDQGLGSKNMIGNKTPTIGIMTALPSELVAVRHLLEVIGTDVHRDARGHNFALLPGPTGAAGGNLVVTGLTSFGQADAAMELFDLAMTFPSLRSFIFVGVAGGTRGMRVGDVIISRRVVYLDEGKHEKDGFVFRGYCPEPTPEFLRVAEQFTARDAGTLKFWASTLKRLLGSPRVRRQFPDFLERISGDNLPRIRLETIGTSSSVVNNPVVRDKWANSGHRVRAFEMEAYGVAMGAKRFSRQYAIVRAVSDHASGDKSQRKDESDQPFAAHVAAACLGLILSNLPSQSPARRNNFTEWPRFGEEPIGIFLDVDKTLTLDIIQREYAKELGCQADFDDIEKEWQEGLADADRFNERLIPLFSRHGLTKRLANEIAQRLPLQPWAERVLSLPLPIYLVSSGPDYYIRELASRFNIPAGNALCSEYLFDAETGLICGCNPVSPQTKSLFTQQMAVRHIVSLGVGDHPRDDGPFLSKVTLPILTRERGSASLRSDTFVTAPNHQAIFNLVQQLRAQFARS